MEETTTTPTGNNKMIVIVVIIIALLALLGGGYYLMQQKGINLIGISDQADDQEPIGTVNGTPVSYNDYQDNYQEISASLEQQGIDPTDPTIAAEIKKQAVTAAINKELLLQKAAEAGISVSDADVESEYQNIVTNVGGEDALAATLENLGRTDDDLRENLSEQLTIDAFVRANTNYDSVAVSDEEINTYYDQAKASSTDAEVPPLEEVKDLIQNQLTLQKQQQIVTDFVESLRAEADIVVNI